MKIQAVCAVLFVWVVGVTCIPIMKKIQPEISKLYTAYVLAVLTVFTVFVVRYSLQL